ncbi:hypothetical protein LG299_12660 [Microbacterium lacus]|uniref:DUF7507 domain-containing protein n=1 Tax=Microbacterium lacus TaxID=415217 RepID=UPI00384E1A51
MSQRSGRRSTWKRVSFSERIRRTRLRRAITGSAAAIALLACAMLAPAAFVASATVPGMPGTPQPGTPVYTETFSNQSATVGAIDIRTYTGGPAAANSTYTADPDWTPDADQCNGWIMGYNTLVVPSDAADSGCSRDPDEGKEWRLLRDMAAALGIAQGQTTTQSLTNQVLTAYTNSSDATVNPGTQFRTVNTIPAIAGHYYAVSAYFAAINCPANSGNSQPSETFKLIVNGTDVTLSTGLNPCVNPTHPNPDPVDGDWPWKAQISKLQSAAYMIPMGTTANLGLALENAQFRGNGNDVAFDLPQIVDVTPQLDKAFNPTLILNNTSTLANNTDGSVANNSYSTMTLTVTNTNDLMAKYDWFITDALPANLVIAPTPNIGGTCAQAPGTKPGGGNDPYIVTAPAGGTTVSVTGGDLALGQASCTITVDVTSAVDGTYINGPANITTNLNPPSNAQLEVINPSIDIVKTVDAVTPKTVDPENPNPTTFSEVGDIVTYKFVLTNTTPMGPTNTVAATTLTNVTLTEDAFSGFGDMGAFTCTPTQPATLVSGATMTCYADYVVQQADLDAGELTNTARATGTTALNIPVTDDDPADIESVQTPEIVLDKDIHEIVDVDADGVTGLGDEIWYSFVITNTGNVTVSNLVVSDPMLAGLGITITCDVTTISPLAPGNVATCYSDTAYIVTQADVDATKVDNVATASGTDPEGGVVPSNPDNTSTPISLFRIPLQIEKLGEDVNGDWVRMDGSSWAILDDVDGEPGAPIVPDPAIVDDGNGFFTIAAIPAGVYWLEELTAPDGFSLLAQPVQFTINPDRTVSITQNGGGAVTAAGQLITVRDVPALVMPATGGSGVLPYLIGGAGLIALSVGLMFLVRRRTGRAEVQHKET